MGGDAPTCVYLTMNHVNGLHVVGTLSSMQDEARDTAASVGRGYALRKHSHVGRLLERINTLLQRSPFAFLLRLRNEGVQGRKRFPFLSTAEAARRPP